MKSYKQFLGMALIALVAVLSLHAKGSPVALTQSNAKEILGADYNGKINIVIPENVVAIDDKVFENCKFLESVKIPNGVKSIGEDTFRDCIVKQLKNCYPEPVEEFSVTRCFDFAQHDSLTTFQVA